MLKGISSILSPDLLKILMEMGHGDEIVIGDGNFPAAALAQRIVRFDGHKITDVLEAILPLYPLDHFVDAQVTLMEKAADAKEEPAIWDKYRAILAKYDDATMEHIERFAFYEQTKKAYAVVATGESEIYANIILKKGIIVGD